MTEDSPSLFKKFKLFTKQNTGEDDEGRLITYPTSCDYTLDQLNIHDMKISKETLFLFGHLLDSVQQSEQSSSQGHLLKPYIFKFYSTQILDQYDLFAIDLQTFEIITSTWCTFLICIGKELSTDFGLNTKLKIFDITQCISPSNNDNKPKEIYSQIIMKKDVDNPQIIFEQTSFDNVMLDGINAVKANNDISTCAIVFEKEIIFIISKDKPIYKCKSNELNVIKYKTEDNDSAITNVIMVNSDEPSNNIGNKYITFYYTTTCGVYYGSINCNAIDTTITAKQVQNVEAVRSKCVTMKDDEIFIATESPTTITHIKDDKVLYELPFEGQQITCLHMFNDYICVSIKNDKTYCLGIYDIKAKFYQQYEETENQVQHMCSSLTSFWYLMKDNETLITTIVQLREMENKEKFDVFFSKRCYDCAIEYANSIRYSPKQIFNIRVLYAQHLYTKERYQQSIDQYIKTINYLDPSVVINKFYESDKLSYLISYLEALRMDTKFVAKINDEEQRGYTALLISCYIKQKEISKLEEFVQGAGAEEQKLIIETAMEVCKEQQEIKTAEIIAQKTNKIEYIMQILIEFKNDFNGVLDVIDKEQKVQSIKLLEKFGVKLFEKAKERTTLTAYCLIRDIIDANEINRELNKSQANKDLMDLLLNEEYDDIMIRHRRDNLYQPDDQDEDEQNKDNSEKDNQVTGNQETENPDKDNQVTNTPVTDNQETDNEVTDNPVKDIPVTDNSNSEHSFTDESDSENHNNVRGKPTKDIFSIKDPKKNIIEETSKGREIIKTQQYTQLKTELTKLISNGYKELADEIQCYPSLFESLNKYPEVIESIREYPQCLFELQGYDGKEETLVHFVKEYPFLAKMFVHYKGIGSLVHQKGEDIIPILQKHCEIFKIIRLYPQITNVIIQYPNITSLICKYPELGKIINYYPKIAGIIDQSPRIARLIKDNTTLVKYLIKEPHLANVIKAYPSFTVLNEDPKIADILQQKKYTDIACVVKLEYAKKVREDYELKKDFRPEKLLSIFTSQERSVDIRKMMSAIIYEYDDPDVTVKYKYIKQLLDRYSDLSHGKDNADEYDDTTRESISEILLRLIDIRNPLSKGIDSSYMMVLFQTHHFKEGILKLSDQGELNNELLSLYMELSSTEQNKQEQYDKIVELCVNADKLNKTKNTKSKRNDDENSNTNTTTIDMNKVDSSITPRSKNYWMQTLSFFINNSNELFASEHGYTTFHKVLSSMQEKHFISPVYLMKLVKNHNTAIPYKAVKEYLVKFIQQHKQKYMHDKKRSESNMKHLEEKENEIHSYKRKSRLSAFGKCPGCRKPLSAPYIYFLCGHGFHKNCYKQEHESTMLVRKYNNDSDDDDYDNEDKDILKTNEKLTCFVCKKAKEDMFKEINASKNDADYLKELKEELSESGCNDKVEVFAKYLGKGVLNVDKWREFCE